MYNIDNNVAEFNDTNVTSEYVYSYEDLCNNDILETPFELKDNDSKGCFRRSSLRSIRSLELMNLTNKQSKLSYFIFRENNLKVLIDTGSTKSFINPLIADKCYRNFIVEDPFQIISAAHGTSIENSSIYLYLFQNYFIQKIQIFN